MADMSGAIRRLKAVPAELRRTGGAWVETRWVPGTPTVTPVQARVQPLSPREAAFMPEGIREKARLTVWLPDGIEIRTVDVRAQTEPDRLVIPEGYPHAGTWVALAASDWRQHGGFVRAVLGDASVTEG